MIRALANAWIRFKSFQTDRKILIIESDDWGSLRTQDKQTRSALNKISPLVSRDQFTQLDTLESHQDLHALFEVLDSVRDKNGAPAKLTANVCVANPNFDAIEDSNFETFAFEPFYETIAKSSDGSKTLQAFREGMQRGYIQPQLHGREHVHALAWLTELRNRNKDLLEAFHLRSWGIPYRSTFNKRRNNLQASLDRYGISGELAFQQKWLADASEIFHSYFGFKSRTFIAPAYTWSSDLHPTLKNLGIDAVQGLKLQYAPHQQAYQRKIHYVGQGDSAGITYLVRNCFFEPAGKPGENFIEETLSSISKAFRSRQIAVLGSHRVNFIGGLNLDNRDKNLRELKAILETVVKKYPVIEFMSTDDLIELIVNR